MKGELVRSCTPDGLELTGLFSIPGSSCQRAVLYLHGMFENFYIEHFVDPISDVLARNQVAFLTVNTRGRDYFADFWTPGRGNDVSWRQIGGCYETFRECVHDIDGWLSFLRERGFSEIVLMGHSHGALKVSYYLINGCDRSVRAAILLSPSDDIGLQKRKLQERFEESLQIAARQVAEGNGRGFMPLWSFDYPISAQTYLEMFGPKSPLGIFTYHEPTQGLPQLGRIRVPILAIMGSEDVAVGHETPSREDARRAVKLIERYATGSRKVQGQVIPKANHYYTGHERELATVVRGWLTRVL